MQETTSLQVPLGQSKTMVAFFAHDHEINLVFRNMWDNMSGFWRMQCADDSFEITAKVRLENPDFEFIVIKL